MISFFLFKGSILSFIIRGMMVEMVGALPISGEYGRWNVKMSDNLVEALVGYLEPLLENEVLR